MARGGSIRDASTTVYGTTCEFHNSQLDAGPGESATVRDITEQYRSIRHLLHVDPAFQLSKQLRGPSALRSLGGPTDRGERGPSDALALEFVGIARTAVEEERAQSRFADTERKIRHMTGPRHT